MITISVSIRQHEPILHGRQLGDYSPNQVASSKNLGAMATKMVATWRVESLSVFEISKFYYLPSATSGKLKHANFNFGFVEKENCKLRLCYF